MAFLLSMVMVITLVPSFQIRVASAAVTEIDLHQTKIGHSIKESWTMHDTPGNQSRTKKAGSHMWKFRIGGKNAYCLDFAKHSFESGDPTYGDKSYFLQEWSDYASWGSTWTGNGSKGASACNSKTKAMIAAAMFVEKNPSGCGLDKTQRRMFAQAVIWAIRCQADWAGSDTISQHKASVITQLNNAMAKISGISTAYSAENIYDYIFKTDWSSYKVRIKFFKSCKYDSKGNVVEVPGYQRFMNIKIVPDEDFDWETVGASEGYHQRVRVHKTDELGRPLAGVKFRLTLKSDTDNVYDCRVSLADGSMADTDDVTGSSGIDSYGNDYLIATTDSSGYAHFFIGRNNSIDDCYGYITSPASPSDKVKALARAEMSENGVTYYASKALARTAAQAALVGSRTEIHDDAMIREEESSLPDAYTTIADYTVYNRKVGGNGEATSTYSQKNEDISSASEGILVSWDQNNVYFKDSKGVWVDEQATATGSHGKRNDVSQVDVVDTIKKIKVRVTKKADTKDGKAHGDATLDGAEYQLYSDAACTQKATVYGDDRQAKTAGVYTTAKGGVMITDYLLCGVTYYLKEVKPSEGFLLSKDVTPIMISGAEVDDTVEFSNSLSKEYIEVHEPHIKNDINIFKIRGEDTGEAEFEHDVTFQIYLEKKGSYEACDDYDRREIVTDKGRGTAKDLPYGKYMVHQVDTGLYDTEKVEDFPITIKEDKTEREWGYETVLLNKNFKAYLKIRKTDANTGQTVLKPDTVFEIFRVDPETGEETQVIQTGSNGKKMITLKQFTTDEEGIVETLQPLESGTYRIRETASAPGLHQVKDYIEVEINSKNDNYKVETDPESKFPTITVTVDYENEETHGRLSIAKKGEQLKGYDPEKKQFTYEEAYLKGVTFEVYAKEDIVTQDNQGTNWYDKGDLVATVHTGEDVQFSKECKGITGYEMDDDGIITLDLPLGEYTVKEKSTLYGYVLPDQDWDVSFTWEDKEASYVMDSSGTADKDGKLDILNLLAKARVSIQKEDNATYKPVQGAVFGLYTADDIYNADGELIVTKDSLLDTVTTDGEGKATSAMDLPLMSENHGKKIDTGSEDETEKPDAGEQEPGQTDKPDAGEQKPGQTGKPDQNKKGSIPDQEKEQGTGRAVGDDKQGSKDPAGKDDQAKPGDETDPENPDKPENPSDPGDLPEDGQSRLNSGNYYFKELSISGSYYLDQTPLAVHVEYQDQDTPLIKEYLVKGNDQTQVEIDKLTLAGSKELPGCKLVVSDTNGNVIIGWTSGDADSIRLTSQADALGYCNLAASMTEKGNLTVSGLLQDTEYVLTETKPADGYVTASDITFKLGAGENNQIYIKNGGTFVKGNTGNRVMMYDDTTKIRFKKIASDTKKQLAGAEFEIYDSKGNQVYSFTTGKKAEKIVGLLAANKTYTFKEVHAPKGYKKAKAVKLKVADSGEFQVVKVKDQAYGKISTARTGSNPGFGGGLSPKTGYAVLTICLTMMMFSSAAAVIVLKRKRKRSV